MTKEEALDLLDEYCAILHNHLEGPRPGILSPRRGDAALEDAVGMRERFPEDASEKKAMRWLGFMQGILVATEFFTKDEVKAHSKNKKVR